MMVRQPLSASMPDSPGLYFQGRTPLWRQNSKPILLSTDVDDTLIHWQPFKPPGYDVYALRRTARALREEASRIAIHLNTGRGLSSFQQAVLDIKPVLASMPVDYLSLNNGHELYVNKRHQRMERWIAGLKPSDQEVGWSVQVTAKTGWTLGKVTTARARALQSLGYVEREPLHLGSRCYPGQRTYQKQHNGRTWIVQVLDNQPGFRFLELLPGNRQRFGAEEQRLGMQVLMQMKQSLQAQGIETRTMEMVALEGTDVFGRFSLTPAAIHKGAVVEELLGCYMRAPRAVISAGDEAFNDTALVTPTEFSVVSGRTVPNYPVLSGTNPALQAALKTHPRAEQVQTGHLYQGIRAQMGKILDRSA